VRGILGLEQRDCAVGDGACSTGVGQYGSVDGEDVSHGEECGGAGTEFGCKRCVTLSEFEVFSGCVVGGVWIVMCNNA